MLMIMGCALPAFEEIQMERFCKIWLKKLAGRLELSQLIHLERFGKYGKAARMRAARILGRSMLLSVMNPSTKLGTDDSGRPCLNNKSVEICFSYTEKAAFCGLYLNKRHFEDMQIGLDAEERRIEKSGKGYENSFFANTGELKSWLKFEAILKAKRLGLSGAPKGAHKTWAFRNFNPAGYHWKFLAFPGHLVCIASNVVLKERPILRWMNYAMLGNNLCRQTNTVSFA